MSTQDLVAKYIDSSDSVTLDDVKAAFKATEYGITRMALGELYRTGVIDRRTESDGTVRYWTKSKPAPDTSKPEYFVRKKAAAKAKKAKNAKPAHVANDTDSELEETDVDYEDDVIDDEESNEESLANTLNAQAAGFVSAPLLNTVTASELAATGQTVADMPITVKVIPDSAIGMFQSSTAQQPFVPTSTGKRGYMSRGSMPSIVGILLFRYRDFSFTMHELYTILNHTHPELKITLNDISRIMSQNGGNTSRAGYFKAQVKLRGKSQYTWSGAHNYPFGMVIPAADQPEVDKFSYTNLRHLGNLGTPIDGAVLASAPPALVVDTPQRLSTEVNDAFERSRQLPDTEPIRVSMEPFDISKLRGGPSSTLDDATTFEAMLTSDGVMTISFKDGTTQTLNKAAVDKLRWLLGR